MNYLTVDIADFRNRLSDYLTLVNLGEAVISVRNGKSGKEIVKIISPVSSAGAISRRTEELKGLAGFAAGYSTISRKKFEEMDRNYTKKLRKGIVK
ncbi:MAG: hypothetical protein M1120_01355 [Patescibacteria group bacterium]|nr:hypothetical protein [Patescibacteria group bacterium]